jgi:hypothetical protein
MGDVLQYAEMKVREMWETKEIVRGEGRI